MRVQLRALGVIIALVTTASALAAIPAGATTHKVGITLKPTSINVGQTAHITGSVSPADPHHVIRLQRFYRNAWHEDQHQNLTSKSTYSFRVSPRSLGVSKYRTALPDAVSRSVALSVYAWHYLSDLPQAGGDGGLFGGVRDIDGGHFPHTVAGQAYSGDGVSSRVGEWNLRKKCVTFDGTLGLTDDSESDASATLTISADGGELYSDTFSYGPGSSSRHEITISGHLRIKLLGEWASGGVAWPGFGDARIRCLW